MSDDIDLGVTEEGPTCPACGEDAEWRDCPECNGEGTCECACEGDGGEYYCPLGCEGYE